MVGCIAVLIKRLKVVVDRQSMVPVLVQEFEVLLVLATSGLCINALSLGFVGLVELLLTDHRLLEGLYKLSEFGLLLSCDMVSAEVRVLLDELTQGVVVKRDFHR